MTGRDSSTELDWIRPCLLADLMIMILNWNKTDGGWNALICIRTSD